MKPEGQRLASAYLDGVRDAALQEELARYLEAHPEELDEFLHLLRDHAAIGWTLSGNPERLPTLVMDTVRYGEDEGAFARRVEEALQREPAEAPVPESASRGARARRASSKKIASRHVRRLRARSERPWAVPAWVYPVGLVQSTSIHLVAEICTAGISKSGTNPKQKNTDRPCHHCCNNKYESKG